MKDKLKKTLLDALRAGGDVLRHHFGKAQIHYKGRANIVTQADRESEERALRIILRRFPGHDYLTEERAPKSSGAEFTWIIDPLDGTTNYAHGYPASCVSIGLVQGNQPMLAGIYDPFRDELFFAEKGGGAFLNGKRIYVSTIRSLDRSLLVTGFPYDRLEKSRFYIRYYRLFMERSHDVRRSGSAALDLAWVAAGRADGFWEFRLAPWDVAAGLLMIREAGGKVTDFSGKAWNDPKRFGYETLATNSRIHREMLSVLRRLPNQRHRGVKGVGRAFTARRRRQAGP